MSARRPLPLELMGPAIARGGRGVNRRGRKRRTGWAPRGVSCGPPTIVPILTPMKTSRAIILFVAVALLAALAASAGALSPPPTTVDDSKDAGKGGAGTSGFDGGPVTGRLTHRGTVSAVKPPLGSAPWIGVTISGSGSPGTSSAPAPVKRTLKLIFTPYELLPLAPRDDVEAAVACDSFGPGARVCDVTVTARPDGKLVLFVSDSGKAPDGWEVTAGATDPKEGSCGGDPKCSVRHDSPLVFRHLGKTAIGVVGSWRRLETSDGKWLVTGHRIWWEGLRLPEGRDYRELAIARAK